jgi:hypothetical protein
MSTFRWLRALAVAALVAGCGADHPAPKPKPKPTTAAHVAPQPPADATERADEINEYCVEQVRPMIAQGAELPPSVRDQIAGQIRSILANCVRSEAESYAGAGHVVYVEPGQAVARP